MSKPAARLTDFHACPMQTPAVVPIPHVGGPIAFPGEPRVLINGLPAARVGDVAICVGPPDVIAMGSLTCLIGGKPAARLGDQTAHGGAIAAGSPNVMIGDSGGGSGGPAGWTMGAARSAGLALTPTSCASDGGRQSVEDSAYLAETDPDEVGWIGIELVDPDGRPVPSEPFELRRGEAEPVGRLLDAEGKARVSGLEPGTYQVVFPALEDTAVEPDGGAAGALFPADDRTEPLAHPVQPGEDADSVTTLAQFRNWRPVWEHPANLELRKARVNPFTLAPEDVITVPPRSLERFERDTEATHRFVAAAPGRILNLRLLDAGRTPLAEKTVRTVLGGGGDAGTVDAVLPDQTDADGRVSLPLARNHRAAELTRFETDETSPPVEIDLMRIAELPPADTVAGLQMRLNNMGYYAGFTPKEEIQLRWAVEEFQLDNGLKVTGKFDDPKVMNAVAHVHGDLLPSEKVPG